MEVEGTIIDVLPLARGMSSKGPWAKASIVVEYEGGRFPKSVLLTNMPKAEEFSQLKRGQKGKFKFDGKTRQGSNGNYYLDLNCWAWDIDKGSGADNDGPF